MKARIARFVESDGTSEPFADLALALHAHQVAGNPLLARLAEGPVRRVEDIPAVPVSLFKELDLCPFPEARVQFLTSGTTEGRRGRHRMRDTELYDLGARRHYRNSVPDAPSSAIAMWPASEESSLDHMVGLFGPVVHEMYPTSAPSPVLLAATAFSLDAFFSSPTGLRLGPRDVVMVTGGFKGRKTRLDAPALYRELPRLGTPRVVAEYGMTELSSQLWSDVVPAGGIPGSFRAPPWLHVYPVDPASGAPAPEGVLRFVDLCNLDTTCAIETMDLGRVQGARVTLLGRVEGADLRGCSLRVEEWLERAT